ncbi:AzlD domain-containing protein [Devosia sp. CN2-171]|uniref:AzlD domain-containing protein n=1 Tax=Devosia sp. CN2-171 TaxID=3400909 RepID=UPI003BF81F82
MSLEALVAILAMAAVTFAIRAGGFLLASRLPSTGFVASWMKHLPGAVLAALVAPAILAGGMAEAIAAAATAVIYIVSRNLFAAMAGGVLAVYLARLALGG